MAKRDIKVLNNHLYGSKEFKTDDLTNSSASVTIKPGEPVKRSTNYALVCATGEPVQAGETLLGIADNEGTETSSADGVVMVQVAGPGTVMRGKPTTTTNMDTASELLAILLDYVTFDLTSTTYTIDENEGDDPNTHGLLIVAGDTTKLTLDVTPHVNSTMFGSQVGQTID